MRLNVFPMNFFFSVRHMLRACEGNVWQTRELAQPLRTHTALSEDPSSGLIIQGCGCGSQLSVTHVPGRSTILF